MTQPFILPSSQVHLSQSAVAKLRRTEVGRTLIEADEAIADRIKMDPEDADRIWIGVRRSTIKPYALRTLHCSIDERSYIELGYAAIGGDANTLAAFGDRLWQCFNAGRKQCPFIQEPNE